jgi:quercetin dioxygenase-like cupin family protein
MNNFLLAKDRILAQLPFGKLARLSDPTTNDAKDLTIMEVHLAPGGGHSFHFHPNQEELIYVVEGEVEQWLEKEKSILKASDAVFIPRKAVHASFNTSKQPARVLAILGPCVGKDGYECVDVFETEAWKNVRTQTRG